MVYVVGFPIVIQGELRCQFVVVLASPTATARQPMAPMAMARGETRRGGTDKTQNSMLTRGLGSETEFIGKVTRPVGLQGGLGRY